MPVQAGDRIGLILGGGVQVGVSLVAGTLLYFDDPTFVTPNVGGSASPSVTLGGTFYATATLDVPTPAPAVQAVSPTSGPARGSQTVTITGLAFDTATQVMFGDVPATSFQVTAPDTITAVVPPQPAGAPGRSRCAGGACAPFGRCEPGRPRTARGYDCWAWELLPPVSAR